MDPWRAWRLLKHPLPPHGPLRATAKSVRTLARAVFGVTLLAAGVVVAFALMLAASGGRFHIGPLDAAIGVAILASVAYAWTQFALLPLALLYHGLAQGVPPSRLALGLVAVVLLVLGGAGPILCGLTTAQRLGEVDGPAYVGSILWTVSSPWLLFAGWRLARASLAPATSPASVL